MYINIYIYIYIKKWIWSKLKLGKSLLIYISSLKFDSLIIQKNSLESINFYVVYRKIEKKSKSQRTLSISYSKKAKYKINHCVVLKVLLMQLFL